MLLASPVAHRNTVRGHILTSQMRRH